MDTFCAQFVLRRCPAAPAKPSQDVFKIPPPGTGDPPVKGTLNGGAYSARKPTPESHHVL